MESYLVEFITGLPLFVLLLLIAGLLLALGKGADIFVDEAVAFAARKNIPKVLIGATIVSLGTTLPEAAVSVYAAVQGEPGLALGNAVGSVICDTGLILGLATLIKPLPLIGSIISGQGRIQLGAGILLVLVCLPFTSLQTVFITGGRLPQFVGFIFLALLAIYLWYSMARAGKQERVAQKEADPQEKQVSTVFMVSKMVAGIAIILVASKVLIPAVGETALRIGIPEGIIGATLVALGTSAPELITAITAVRKGHGELALGNVIGADILNVLFVAGAAAAVTKGGLEAPSHFFTMLFPGMLFLLIVFRIGTKVSKNTLKRPFGVILIVVYILIMVLSYTNGAVK